MHVDLGTIILLVAFGFLFGNIATISGIGGGTFYVPLMTLLFFVPMDMAVGTSAFIILFSSGAAFFTYLKEKRTNLRLTLIFGGFSVLGALLSTIIFQILFPIENFVLAWIFAFVLIITGLIMLGRAFKSNNEKKKGIESIEEISIYDHNYKNNLKKGIPLFILAGFLANLIGIGGGVVNIPSLHLVLGFSIHNAAVLSTSIVFITAIYNTIIKSLFGLLNFIIGILIGVGSVIGSIIGAKISRKIPKIHLQFFISIVLIVLAVRMFF